MTTKFVGSILAIGLALVGLTACSLPWQRAHAAATTYTLSGHLDLAPGDWAWSQIGGPCFGTGGFSDISAGAQVSVLNASGKILGLGKLENGMGQTADDAPCILDFNLKGLPHSAIYQLRVNQRGGPAYSFGDLQRSRWTIAVTLDT